MGGSKSKPEAPRVTAQQTAGEVLAAQRATDLPAQQLAFQRMSDPESGIGAFTQLQEDVRQQVFGGEQAVREALQQQILQSLQSPTGLTPQQQAAQDAVRVRGITGAQRAQRTRANLGGNLFGGRAQAAEQGDINNLINQYMTEDIARQDQQRQEAVLNAQQLIQMLFPDIGIGATPFTSPVPGANEAIQAGTTQRGQDVTFQQEQEANQAAMQQALFSSLGTAAAAAAAPFTGGASALAIPAMQKFGVSGALGSNANLASKMGF